MKTAAGGQQVVGGAHALATGSSITQLVFIILPGSNGTGIAQVKRRVRRAWIKKSCSIATIGRLDDPVGTAARDVPDKAFIICRDNLGRRDGAGSGD